MLQYSEQTTKLVFFSCFWLKVHTHATPNVKTRL